ncbi:MAG: amidase [Alphaproteobacteria bacterium]
MLDDDVCYMSAREVVTHFKTRKLSPREFMEAVIARSEKVGPKVNAYTHTSFDRALERAKGAEAKYTKTSARLGRLEGLPVVIKDLHPIKGEITTSGSKLFADHRDTFTLAHIERLFRAGAILLARTTTPEFGAAAICHSPLWGVTRNPWNLDYSPGGSSGGAAAAVAIGMAPLADGSDYGGSIRIPASCCGVFGYKPPYGRNPRPAPWNLDPYGHYGPITRTVADGALMQNVMSGIDPRDIATLRQRVTIPERLEGIEGWRIAFSIDLGYFEVDEEVQRNTRAAVEVFRDLGCEVEEVDLGWTSASLAAFDAHSGAYFAAKMAQYLPRGRYDMSNYACAVVEAGARVSTAAFYDALAVQAEMYDRLGPLLGRYNVLLCPTTAVAGVPAEHSPLDSDFRINGKRVPAHLQWVMTYPFNMLSQCPVATVPTGFAASGVATGLQIVGRSYDDVSVFRAAAAYERARPWLDKPDSRPRL